MKIKFIIKPIPMPSDFKIVFCMANPVATGLITPVLYVWLRGGEAISNIIKTII